MCRKLHLPDQILTPPWPSRSQSGTAGGTAFAAAVGLVFAFKLTRALRLAPLSETLKNALLRLLAASAFACDENFVSASCRAQQSWMRRDVARTGTSLEA